MLTALKCTLGTITIFGIGFITGVLAWDKFLWNELMDDLVDDNDDILDGPEPDEDIQTLEEFMDSLDGIMKEDNDMELTSLFVKNTKENLESDNSCGCNSCGCED